MIVIDAHSENLTVYSAYLATLRLYNSIQITFPNQSLEASEKTTNVEVTAFILAGLVL